LGPLWKIGAEAQRMAASAWTTLHSALLLCFAAAVFAVYFRTMFPSVPGGDSGEMIAIACLGAVPHPPVRLSADPTTCVASSDA
jgi:hypothetical protein